MDFDEEGKPIQFGTGEIDDSFVNIYPVKTESIPFPQLISDVEQGNLVIPAFQRDFVWSLNESLDLLNSIYRNYPVGSFLFWETKKIFEHIKKIGNYELNRVNENADYITYILDGQQRIASIYACLKKIFVDKKERKQYVAYFDLDNEEFVSEKEVNDEKRYINFSDLFKLHLYISDRYTSTNHEDIKRKKIFYKLYYSFINYHFTAIKIKNQPISVVSEIFEKVNTGGKKLTVVDLAIAKSWSIDFDLRMELKKFREKLKNKSYTTIEDKNVLQSFSIIMNNSRECGKENILDVSVSQKFKENLSEIIRAIELSIDFLKKRIKYTRF